ncbi:MAG TPA: PQQ-binding-like beta-propeller repeat protein, partial [Pirellulales bacterium]
MSTQPANAQTDFATATNAAARPIRPMRLWPAIGLIAAYWVSWVGFSFADLTISAHFFTSVIGPGVLLLLFLIWWGTNRGVRWTDRLLGIAAVVGGCVLAVRGMHPSVGFYGALIMALPIGLTIWVVWLMAGGRRSRFVRCWGAILSLLPIWILFGLTRSFGIDGNLHADMHWRWTPSPEELLIAERTRAGDKTGVLPIADAAPLTLEPGDWPGLRGKNRDGIVRDLRIATDWSKLPPKQIWRHPIGPAWSSFAVVGSRLFTQEQRDEAEAVVCLDAATGHEIWVHTDHARHWDGQGGAGPRGTPSFADDRIYSLGATGALNCLDAASGKSKWMRNIADEAQAAVPMWGFSGSPLVVGQIVIVYAGGEKGLLAYRAATGEPAWSAAT